MVEVGSDKVVWAVVVLSFGRAYYACGEDGFLTSSDGQNWNVVSQPDPGKMYCRLAVSPDEPQVVFSVFASVLRGGASDFSARSRAMLWSKPLMWAIAARGGSRRCWPA